MSNSPVITVENAGVCYRATLNLFGSNGFWALKDLNFELYQGETLGIIGRNGSGKSTLMRLLAGIIKPDTGKVISPGIDVLLLSLRVGFMPQLSGRENIIMSGILLGMRRRRVIELIDSIIEYSGITDFIDMPVRTYSSGMKARLGFAVACHANPDVLLMDEVLGVGDKDFREKSLETTKQMINSDCSVVIVSHSEKTIKEYCHRAIWVEDGMIKMIGDTDEVLEAYDKSKKPINKK